MWCNSVSVRDRSQLNLKEELKMKYRDKALRLALSKDQPPENDYILYSDVVKLLSDIESDFNSLKDRIVSDLDDIKHETEKRLEAMSDDLY
jgi:hypothetical protein